MSSPETEPTDPVDDLVELADGPAEGVDAPATDQAPVDQASVDQSPADQAPLDPTAGDRTAGGTVDGHTTGGEAGDDVPGDVDASLAQTTGGEATGDGATGDDDADGRSLLSGLPPLSVPDPVEPVRRRRRRGKGSAEDTASVDQPPMPSLTSPLLSGRSLEPTRPKRRFELLRDHPRWLIAAVVLVLVVVGLVAGKLLAESAADSAMETRSAELEELLADATPEEFLAFSSGVEQPGSIAERTRNLDGFVNVKATASESFIRFQPSGWWAGFTERCLVAVVRADGVTITVPKKACIRVEAPPS